MYGYQYDDLNRLLKGNYRKLGYSVTGNYDETLRYDKHGNITSLQRNGFADADFGMSVQIDNLAYTYSGNRLQRVTDSSNSLNGFRDGSNSGNDFDYDNYGNMTRDHNKQLRISYNHLNLPIAVEFDNMNRILYQYNAAGEKLLKSVRTINPPSEVITEYIDGFQYKNGVLKFFPTAEGYVEFVDPTKYFYVYNYTDHLGNVRMSYTNHGTEAKILEESHYYPFGLKHENYASERFERIRQENGELYVIQPTERREWQYKYNGKEWQDELGLNFYDYGARNYDAAIGRWMNVDPLAIAYNQDSPYNYSLNNPVYFKDPDGKRVIANDEETQKTILAYLTDQLGENHGFSFNKKGELGYKNKDLKKASKGFNDEQKSIVEGLKEVVDDKDKTIEVVMNQDSNAFSVTIYEPGFVKDENGKLVYDDAGVPKREGWQSTGLVADFSTENTGGAIFYATGKLDKTKQGYGYVAINRKIASSISIKGEGGKLTTPSESSVFIHEILDHGLDFVRNGNINSSSGPGVENIKFHNQALKNISKGESPMRNTHYDQN